MSKRSKLKLVKDYIIKLRLEKYMGTDMESVVITTYHTYIISTTTQSRAKLDAVEQLGTSAGDCSFKIDVEHCTEGV